MSKWLEWQQIMAAELRGQGKSIREIAAAIGRTYNSVDSYLRKDRTNEARRRRRDGNPVRRDNVSNVSVPLHLIADRDRRSQERAAMSGAAVLLGEPVPSQSALARRP